METKEDLKIKHILSNLEELQYGSIIITVHDGEITQIDTTEKKRFPLLKRSVKVKWIETGKEASSKGPSFSIVLLTPSFQGTD